MRLITVLVALLILFSSKAEAEQATTALQPALVKAGTSASAFIPKGWEIEAKAEGDLNRDGRSDIAFVLRKADPSKVSEGHNTNPRVLAVSFGDEGSRYKLALQHGTFIPADNDLNIEDPFGGIAIQNGALKVTFHYWTSAGSWTTGNTVLTFRYQDDCFKLIGSDSSSMHRATLEESSTSKNYLAGKMVEVSQSDEHSKKRKTITSKFEKKPLKCISEIGNGMEYYD